MKLFNLKSLALFVFAGLFLASCSQEEEPPTLNFIAGSDFVTTDSEVESGDTFTVSITATAGSSEMENLNVTRDGSPLSGYPVSLSGGEQDNYSAELDFIPPLNPGQYGYTFTITDAEGLTAEETIIITVIEASSAGGPIDEYSAKLLGDFQNQNTGSFFASASGMVYSQSEAKNNSGMVDFCYYHGASNGPTIASPDNSDAQSIYDNSNTGIQTWSQVNNTDFKVTSLSAGEFDAIEDDVTILEESDGASGSDSKKLSQGDVVAFVTDGGKAGLFKVLNITGDPNSNGEIEIDVKVQQ